MRNLAERRHEERILLYQVFSENATTDNEKIIGYRNAKFIEECLEVMKLKPLMGIGSKRSGAVAFHQVIDNMLEAETQARYDLGLIELTKLKMSEIDSVMYNFYCLFSGMGEKPPPLGGNFSCYLQNPFVI